MQQEPGLPVLYASQSLGEILGLTDQLIVLEQGKVLYNGLLFEIAKQQGMLRYLGIRQIDNILPVTILSHDFPSGCSLAHSFGLPLTLPLRADIAAGSQTQVSIRANDIALSRSYITGISIQNQIRGRICALIPSGESLIVQYEKPVWNLHDALKLPEWLSVSLEQRTRYESVGGPFKAGSKGGDQQIPLQTTLWLQAHLGSFRFGTEFNFETGWAHLFKGSFAKDAPRAPDPVDVNYFYVQSMLRF